MSNTIPPLLCSTPPPIDFDDGGGDNEPDDFEPYDSAQGVYGQFEGPSEPNTPKHQKMIDKNELELPIPDFIPFPTKIPVDTAKRENTDQIKSDPGGTYIKNENDETRMTELNDMDSSKLESDVHTESNDNAFISKDTIGFIISEPPPIDVGYSSESQSPKNSRGDSPLSIEFSPGNLSDDDASIDFQINESRYDDNTSLPSLKFDAINISKSATPISEDKSITNKSPILDELPSVGKEENQSAFDSPSSIENLDPNRKTRSVADDDVLEENTRTECEIDDETLWNGSSFEDVEQLEIHARKDKPAAKIQRVSNGENFPVIEDLDPTHLDCNPSTNEDTSINPAVSSLDDDFTDDFQAFEGFDGAQNESGKEVVTESGFEFNNDDIAFEADFSQVDFPPVHSTLSKHTADISKLAMPSNQPNTIDENADDEFEDFQDFKAVERNESDSKIIKGDSNDIANEGACSKDNENTDEFSENDYDEFGDFSDFKAATIGDISPVVEQSQAVDLSKIDGKVKNVLQIMFPGDPYQEKDANEDKINMPGVLGKNLNLDLREVDSAKALEYQWLNSNIKNSLVKSLGIDSRNILYGEKWNSSMPRFAANLGFGPLEPLKPTKPSLDSSSILQPLKPSSTGSVEKPSISSNGSSDVPAVKFDWNTSGLVNPLDASHAHTLLLDLDQLVVVANLDKIKLDSSSPCSSAPLTRTTTAIPANIAHSSGDIIATASTFNCIRNSYLPSTVYQQSDKTENAYTDDKYIDVIRLDLERNTADGFVGGGGGDGDENTAWINNIMNTLNLMTTDNMTTNTSTAFAINNINCINATNRVTNTAPLGLVNNSHNDIFDQYLDCRVKEILHEGKTETIHSTKSNDTNGSNNLATTDQNTTTTNQAPINYIASLSSIDNDLKESNEIKENVVSNTNHTNFRTDENYMKPSALPTTSKLIPLKETHIFTPSKSECTISRSVTKASEKVPIDFDYEIAAAGIVINEQVVNKEYRDVVYNPEAQIRTAETLVAEVSLDENRFKKDQINPMVDPNKNFRHKSAAPDLLSGPILNIMEKKPDPALKAESSFDDEFSDFQQNTLPPANQIPPFNQLSGTVVSDNGTLGTEKSSLFVSDSIRNENKSQNIDDEFTDFQSVPPPAATSQTKAISDVKPRSRTGTPVLSDEMILSPAVLLPQAVQLTCSEPKINWPGNSDIDPEELARLEQLFPQAKQVAAQSYVGETTAPVTTSPKREQKDDDDWSDFVSVPPSVNSGTQNLQEHMATATATKLSTISKTYDDDDWSDFVSSTPAPIQSIAKPWSLSNMPPPQFSSWNQPSTVNTLPTLSTLQGGYSTSHLNYPPQNFNSSSVPTMPGKTLHQSNVYANNNQFLINGHYNQLGVYQRPQQQHNVHSNQQRLPQLQHQLQKQQRTSSSSNSNIDVLKSQLNLAPSISLIPDLSFTTPKPLVNLSRTNTSSKK